MDCDICGKEIGETIVLLPIRKSDGAFNTFACLECALASPCYCKKHERPHLGFEEDDTTACMLCIEELVEEKKPQEIAILDELTKSLPPEKMKSLAEWAEISSFAAGNPGAVCILRAIATRALRMRITFEELKDKMIEEKSIEIILPGWS